LFEISFKGKSVAVTWIYEAEDEEMREAGEDFKHLVKIPLSIINAATLP
jgi:hypothetical protein